MVQNKQMLHKTGECRTWWKPVVALGVVLGVVESPFAGADVLPLTWLNWGVGEIGCALPSKIALEERVDWFIAVPHLPGDRRSPLVDAHAEVCLAVAARMSGSTNSSCCCAWSLLELLPFPKPSLTPLFLLHLFFLSHSTITATIQGAGSACVQSRHLFSVADL